jgi:hypothetical protein
LNGIIEQSYAEGQLSPAPDQEMFSNESKTPVQFAKDKIKGKLDKVVDSAKADLKALAEKKKAEVLQRLKDETINRIPKFENVFSNVLRRADQASTTALNEVIAGRNIGAAIQANVYGILPGSTIGQGLNKAAVNNLGNIYK